MKKHSLVNDITLVVEEKHSKYISYHVARLPHLSVIRESYQGDYGLLWGVFAYPNTIFKRGIGKTVLAIKILLGAYDSWAIAREYIVYDPRDFVRLFERLVDRQERIPVLVWDDAGVWLSKDKYKDRFVSAVAEHLEVIRTHIGTVLFTATSYGKLAKSIRESLNLIDLVTLRHIKDGVKYSKTRGYQVGDDASWLFKRSAMPTPLWEFNFKAVLPDDIYRDYSEIRARYVELSTDRMKRRLREIAEDAAAELEEIAGKSEGVEG